MKYLHPDSLPDKRETIKMHTTKVNLSLHLLSGANFYGRFRKPYKVYASGVYAIHMHLNGNLYVYIGQTKDIFKRIKDHVRFAGYADTPVSDLLIKVINAGGEISCVQLSDNCKEEEYYINLHKSVGHNVINIAKGLC